MREERWNDAHDCTRVFGQCAPYVFKIWQWTVTVAPNGSLEEETEVVVENIHGHESADE